MRRPEFSKFIKVGGVGIFLLLFFFFLATFSEIPFDSWELFKAQIVKMSFAIQPAPSITTSKGDVITPTQSESNQFEAATEETFIFVRPDDSLIEVIFFIGTTQLTLDLYIDAYENIPPIADDRPLPTGKNIAGGVIYEIRAFEGTTEITTFDAPFAVNFHYLEEHIAGFIEETLDIYFWDESQSIWTALPVSSRDTLQNIISVLIDHLTLFVLLGEIKEVAPSGDGITGGGGGEGASLAFLEDEATPLVEEVTLPEEEVFKEPIVEESTEGIVPEGGEGDLPARQAGKPGPALFDILIEPTTGEVHARNIITAGIMFVVVFIGTTVFISFSVWKRRRK